MTDSTFSGFGATAPNVAAVAAVHAAVTNLQTQVAALRANLENAATPQDRVTYLAEWAAARDNLRGVIGEIDPVFLFAGVDARVPLALLPVRLETRYADPGTNVLRVRIFPDEIHVDGHDAELTDSELAMGSALWAAPADILVVGETAPTPAVEADLPTGRRARWAAMNSSIGAARAAWVAQATRPKDVGGSGIAPTTKPHAYVRPAVARGLPDRWHVRAYVGETVVGQAWTSPIGAAPHLAPDPQAVPDSSAVPTDLPLVDPEIRWLIDYGTAVTAGMAVDVPLPPETDSVDRVIAVGVRASTSPADAATELAGLLTAHRYTDGLGFLAVGSPTSNNPDGPAAADRHSSPDDVWQAEFGAQSIAGNATSLLSAALGIDPNVVNGTRDSDDAGDVHAQAMQTALWAATWGYYLGELLDDSALSPSAVDNVRTHYLAHVRGRGSLPTLRLGSQPYGVLPVLPLARWTTDGASSTVDGLAALLTRVRPLWQYGVGSPVTAHEGPDFDAAFGKVMSTSAVARRYSMRSVVADRSVDPLIFTGINAKPGNGIIDSMISTLLSTKSNPLILDIYSPTAEPVRAPWVVDPTDKNPNATVQAAIKALEMTNPHLVLTEVFWLKPTPQGPATLLHTLLRRSVLLEYANTGITLGSTIAIPFTPTAESSIAPVITPAATSTITPVIGALAQPHDQPGFASVPASQRIQSSMFVGLSPAPGGGFEAAQTMPNVLTSSIPSVTGGMATGEWLWRNLPTLPVDVRRTLDETLQSLDVLSTLDVTELEELLPEVLDLATHRWTAWAESLAAEKLTRLRTATGTGIALGGWGVVEGVTRRARVAVDTALAKGAASGALWEELRPGGFVHAPSTAQAATAAVLRAGHLAHGGDTDATFATDLSSARARIAVNLAQGIAGGQELGALLGYECERYLHEHDADVLIDGLRSFAPRWRAGGTFVEGDPQDIVSPSAVVDGLALALAEPDAVAAAVLTAGSPPALASTLDDALDELRQHQHALADLMTAEALHHVLTGNTARASAVLDASHRGGIPPTDFDVLRTPRTGNSVTSRVAVVMPPQTGQNSGGWPTSPRGTADPAVEAWLAHLLPAWSAVQITVVDDQGVVSDASLPSRAQIGLLDVVLDQPEMLRTRVELALTVGTTLAHGRDPAWHPAVVSFDEVITAAGDLREVLASRALRQSDFLAPGSPPSTADERDGADLLTRLTDVTTGMQSALAALVATAAPFETAIAAARGGATAAASGVAAAQSDVSDALITAMGYGVIVHVPSTRLPADVLIAVHSAIAELQRRVGLAAPAPGATVDELVAALKALLGSAQPALPLLTVDAQVGAVTMPALANGDASLVADPELASDWMLDAAGVRTHVDSLVAAMHSCDAFGALQATPDRWRIIDPSAAGGKWAANLSADELATLSSPAMTLVVHADPAQTFEAGQQFSGLLIDEWVEVVPRAQAATSVAYQADAPSARAPQSILLGIAPNVAAGWDVESIVDLVREAVDLAKLRTVDAETGAWIGRMLPAVLLPDGDATDVIAAPPFPLLQVDVSILAAERMSVKGLG